MEGGMERKKKPLEKPKRLGGAQGFTHAMLIATLAAINAPKSADAQEMPSGVNRAVNTLNESGKRRVESKWTTIESAHSRQALLEQHRDDAVKFFRDHPNLFDSIAAPDLRNILDRMETVNQESVKGTRYEFKGVPTGERALESKKAHGNGITLRFYEENPDGPGLKERYVLVTARHVADSVPSPNGKEWTHHPRNVDLSAVELGREDAIMAMPLFLGRKNQDTDLSGEVVSILGIDTDKEKHIPSVLSPRMTDHLSNIASMYQNIDWQGNLDPSQGTELRFVIIPHEEMELDTKFDTNKNGSIDPEEHQIPKLAGMSGSPLVYLPQGGKGVEFCGLLIAGSVIEVEGKSFSVGLVVDQKQVWETIRALPGLDKQRNAERPQEGAPDGFVTTVNEVR
jgi:hypothetical protein